MQRSPGGRVLIRGCHDWQQQRSAVPGEELFVDCRESLQDDPNMVKLLGARLCDGGVIARLLLQRRAEGDAAGCFCEIARRSGAVEQLALAEAVAAVREAQRRQEQAAMERYQRQLNSQLMGRRRMQALGLHPLSSKLSAPQAR